VPSCVKFAELKPLHASTECLPWQGSKVPCCPIESRWNSVSNHSGTARSWPKAVISFETRSKMSQDLPCLFVLYCQVQGKGFALNWHPGHRDQEIMKMLIVVIIMSYWFIYFILFLFYFLTPERKIIIIIIIITFTKVTLMTSWRQPSIK
jgi:hypothetical protein